MCSSSDGSTDVKSKLLYFTLLDTLNYPQLPSIPYSDFNLVVIVIKT